MRAFFRAAAHMTSWL